MTAPLKPAGKTSRFRVDWTRLDCGREAIASAQVEAAIPPGAAQEQKGKLQERSFELKMTLTETKKTAVFLKPSQLIFLICLSLIVTSTESSPSTSGPAVKDLKDPGGEPPENRHAAKACV